MVIHVRRKMPSLRRVLVACAIALAAQAFYLPGVEPISHQDKAEVRIMVNSVRSLSEIIPFNYYKLPFCRPKDVAVKPEVLGEILWGDVVQTSNYVVNMRVNQKCKLVQCDLEQNNAEIKANIGMLEQMIDKGYRGYMSIDNLPVFNNGSSVFNGNCLGPIPEEQTYKYLRGYALGVNRGCVNQTLINNHLDFRIEYHEVENSAPKEYRVVGFTATPYSVMHQPDGGDCTEDMFNPKASDVFPISTADVRKGKNVLWSYGVTWINNPNIRWASRWDAYLNTSEADTTYSIHWEYIVTSLVVAACLSLVASIILMRTLHKDFNRYNSPDPDENQEEVGWKLVHADVFRPPYYSHFLAALTGNGVQICTMTAGVLFFALLGFLSPASRGALLTSIIVLYVFMSFVSGFACGKLIKYFGCQEWRWVFFTAMGFPGFVCGGYFITDLINAYYGASDAIPFTTMLTIFALWLCISVPLTVLGASFAFHQSPLTNPVPIGKLAREIPAQRWYLQSGFLYTVPPLVPLGAAFMELKFIFSSLWQGMVYYVFGFLTIVAMVWTVTIALTAIITVYYMLCYENHRWWWTAFIAPGAFGMHLFIYSIYFYWTQLNITTFASSLIYVVYMGMISFGYGLAAGAIGLMSGIYFVRKIYGSIKID
jgi:transmembrane 9 superfamily protein 2/4